MKTANWGQLLGGLAIFIFAMSLLEESLKELAGRPFKKFLQRQTSHKLRAIAAGTVVTAVLQSSSVVLLMVLSFVGAGVISMRNALAVTLGANLGSTVSSWVVATLGFNVALDAISYPTLAFSLVLKLLFPANNNIRNLTRFVIGFALLFIGLEWMKVSVTGLVAGVDVSRYAAFSPYLFIPLGMLLTAVIQSSSATMAITLTALYNHVIPFESAACIVIGSELGTTLKIVIGSWEGMADKKRVAWGNFIFNIVVTLLAIILLYPLIYVIHNWLRIGDELIGLVTFQTGINILTIVVFYPFVGKFGDYLDKLFRKGKKGVATKYIHNTSGEFRDEMLKDVEKETIRLVEHAVRLNRKTLGLDEVPGGGGSWLGNLKKFAFEKTAPGDEYRELKQLHGEILEFLVDIQKENMEEMEVAQTARIIAISQHIMRAAKNMEDVQHNITEINASANDILHDFLLRLRETQRTFYAVYQKLLESPGTADVAALFGDNRTQFDMHVAGVLDILRKRQITEFDSSTLLNVYREIYSSNKGLLRALEGMRSVSS